MNSRVKGEGSGNIISLFSTGCFGIIVCSNPDDRVFASGRKKKKKLHLNFLNSEAGELLKACMSESF